MSIGTSMMMGMGQQYLQGRQQKQQMEQQLQQQMILERIKQQYAQQQQAQQMQMIQQMMGGGQPGQGQPGQVGQPGMGQGQIGQMGMGRGAPSATPSDYWMKPTVSMGPSGMTMSVTPTLTEASKKRTAEADEQMKAKSEVLKLSEKARANFGRSMGLFKNIVAQIKGAEKEQGGLGLGPGLKGQFGAKTKRPGFGRVSSAYGQRVETALSLNSILTGQNRVIRSVVSMILNSLPGPLDPPDQVASKLSQSIRNAYMLTKAYQKAGFTPEKLRNLPSRRIMLEGKPVEAVDIDIDFSLYALSEKEEKKVEAIIQDILRTPIAKARTLPSQEQEQLQRQQPIGQQSMRRFPTLEAAERANLPKGTVIMIGNRRAVIE